MDIDGIYNYHIRYIGLLPLLMFYQIHYGPVISVTVRPYNFLASIVLYLSNYLFIKSLSLSTVDNSLEAPVSSTSIDVRR